MTLRSTNLDTSKLAFMHWKLFSVLFVLSILIYFIQLAFGSKSFLSASAEICSKSKQITIIFQQFITIGSWEKAGNGPSELDLSCLVWLALALHESNHGSRSKSQATAGLRDCYLLVCTMQMAKWYQPYHMVYQISKFVFRDKRQPSVGLFQSILWIFGLFWFWAYLTWRA